MKKTIGLLLMLLIPLFAAAQEIPSCHLGEEDFLANYDNNLTYTSNNAGADDQFSVRYELQAARFIQAGPDSPAHWTYVFVQECWHDSSVGADNEDLLACKVGKDVSYLPTFVTLNVYQQKDLSKVQLEKLQLAKDETSSQVRIIDDNQKLAVLSAPSNHEFETYFDDFEGNFFPKQWVCGNNYFLQYAQSSVL